MFFEPQDAEQKAAALNAEGDDWTYKPVHFEKWSVVEIYDEEDILVGRL